MYICTFWGYKCYFLGILKPFSLRVRGDEEFILKWVLWDLISNS